MVIIGVSQGINLFNLILTNATSLIGIIGGLAGLYFLFYIYRRSKNEEDKWIGVGLLVFGGIVGIGSIFIDLLRILFSNTIVLVLIIGFIILVYLKKEGILE